MITNIAGEEAESPADPNSDLGQMSKKVCLCTFFYIPVINLIISIVLSEHVDQYLNIILIHLLKESKITTQEMIEKDCD